MFTFTWFRTALCGVMVNLCLAWCSVWGSEPTEFPAEARQRYDKGRDFQEKGDLAEAISAFDEAIKLGMDAFPRVHLQRASSNLGLKKYDTAILQYTKFIEEFGLEKSCRQQFSDNLQEFVIRLSFRNEPCGFLLAIL